jgi:hypothetical protein
MDMAGGITCFLLREEMFPVLEAMQHLLPDASVREDGEEVPVQRFTELVKEALHWEKHGRDWHLHGTRLGNEIPVLKMAHQEGFSCLDGCAYVEKLYQDYSWSMIPWGAYGTGLMMILIASEDEIFTKVMDYLEILPRNLVVSCYTIGQLRNRQFRGAIFRSPVDSSVSALWKYGRGSGEAVLALSVEREESVSGLPSGVEMISETHGYQFGAVRRRWVRILDERALTKYVNGSATIITAPDLNEKVSWLALQDFGGVADHVNKDRLAFGLKALESVSWIYIPKHDDERWEIYINRDPAVTTRLFQSEVLTLAPHFSHRHFC